jgi:DNA-binding GntR family transcriptional regulator
VTRAAYEYAVLRIVPRVEREEFVNAGVILHAPRHGFLGTRLAFDEARLRALAPELSDEQLETLRRHLEAVRAVADGEPGAGPIARLPARERFHHLVAPRSTSIQVSGVHTGIADDPAEALRRIFEVQVLRAP